MADSPSGSGGTPRPPLSKPEARKSAVLPPPIRRAASSEDRVVVTLSSVAKLPPPLNAVAPVSAAALPAPPLKRPGAENFPPPGTSARPSNSGAVDSAPVLRAPQLNRTARVKLPEKSGVLPKLTSLANAPLAHDAPKEVCVSSAAPPASAPVRPGGSLPPPPPPTSKPGTVPAFKLKPLRLDNTGSGDSIFPDEEPAGPAGMPKNLPPRELTKPAEPVLRAPGLREDVGAGHPGGLLPPPHITEKPTALQVAPPLVNHSAPEPTEKHHLPPALKKIGEAGLAVPALVEPASAKPATPPPLNPPQKEPAAPPQSLSSYLSSENANRIGNSEAAAKGVQIPKLSEASPAASPVESRLANPEGLEVPKKMGKPSLPPDSGFLLGQGGENSSSKTDVPATPVPPAMAKAGAVTQAPPPIQPPVALPFFAALFARKMKKVALPGQPVTNSVRRVKKTSRPATLGKSAELPMLGAVSPPPKLPTTVAASATPPPSPEPGKPPAVRAIRNQKRRLVETISFYVIFLGLVVPLLFLLGIRFSSETRVEGQVIPPPGTMLCNEVWIVSDFRSLASGIADDLAADRAPKIQNIQERQDHVHRAQADIAAREERIRLLNDQVQAAKDEINSVIKQAHDSAQKVWDGPGAELEAQYKSHLEQLRDAIVARAKSLNLKYIPDDTYQSPEVWANAYRLALYQTPPGVDGTKEHKWIEDQLVAWRAFTKTYDDTKEKLRAQASQIQLSPTAQVTDVNTKIDDLKHRIDSTETEEEPLKTELQQAQTDLTEAQTTENGLDAKYYQQLSALPESSITKRLPLAQNGRFSWRQMEKDSAFSKGDRSHSYWIFARAIRGDGRQYWVLAHFSIAQNTLLPILIEPASFISTKSILRPDLSADEQQQ